jgi:hypothetical protein
MPASDRCNRNYVRAFLARFRRRILHGRGSGLVGWCLGRLVRVLLGLPGTAVLRFRFASLVALLFESHAEPGDIKFRATVGS